MRRASIDIGTNSVRLLIAEKLENGEWNILSKKLNSTRLGEGMSQQKNLSAAAKERTLRAVADFVNDAKEVGIDDLYAYGTAIFRDSPDGASFAKEVEEKTQIPLHILSGTEEAFYSYVGAAGSPGALTAVVDIGGGSTEICMGFGNDIGFRTSLPLGCVRCTGQFDMVGARGIGELKKHCFELFSRADEVAAKKIQGFEVNPEDVTDLLKKLFNISYEERCHLKGLRPERADIIVAGVTILDALMEYFAVEKAIVSDRDLQEGLLEADVISPV